MRDTPISRRDLLRAAGAAALALPLGAACASRPAAGAQPSGAAPSSGAGPLVSTNVASGGAVSAAPTATAARVPGIQLYTVRALMQQDVEGTLAALAGMGYKEVEFAGYFGRDPKALRRTLDGLGLRAPSAHIPLDTLRTALGPALDAAAVLGHEYVVCPYLTEPERTPESYRRLVDDLGRIGAQTKARGVQLAYHNHDFEFKPMPDGRLPYDLLLSGTDASTLAMEIDLYWATYAGRDALQYITANPERFQLCHAKDLRRTADGGRQMADVGEGSIDFRTIFSRAHFRHYFVERDDAKDPLASARTSVRALQALLA